MCSRLALGVMAMPSEESLVAKCSLCVRCARFVLCHGGMLSGLLISKDASYGADGEWFRILQSTKSPTNRPRTIINCKMNKIV